MNSKIGWIKMFLMKTHEEFFVYLGGFDVTEKEEFIEIWNDPEQKKKLWLLLDR